MFFVSDLSKSYCMTITGISAFFIYVLYFFVSWTVQP